MFLLANMYCYDRKKAQTQKSSFYLKCLVGLVWKKLVQLNMLGETGTKNLNLLKIQDGAGLEKTYSTHYFI